jgi:TolA-binding protein
MGTGGTNGGKSNTVSYRDKIKEISSSLIKMAVNSTGGLKAALANLTAKDDKVIASLPGRANKEIPNKSVGSILAEGVKIGDIIKIVIGVALSGLTGNPIPLMLAERHAKNLNERVKAKQKEVSDRIKDLNKQIKDAKKISKISVKNKLYKNEADYKQLQSLRSRISAKEREARVAVKRAERQATKKVSDIDKNILKDVKSAFVKLGYNSSDAKKAAEIALSKTNSRDVTTVITLAIKEAANLGNK